MNLRKSLNKLIKPYGYQILKIDRFRQQLVREYEKYKEFIFVQVGAHDGIKYDDLFGFVATHRSRGIVVEPLRFYYKKLKENYSPFPGVVALNKAIHGSKRKMTMHYVDPGKLHLLPEWAEGLGSFDPDHHKKTDIPHEYMIVEQVECVHLMEIIREFNTSHISLLQVDVEGYDYEVLKMIDFDVVKPKLIKYEHDNLEKQEQADAVQLLKSHGYDVFVQGSDSVGICTI